MLPLPGNLSWERNLRTISRRTRQHSIVLCISAHIWTGHVVLTSQKEAWQVWRSVCVLQFSRVRSRSTHTHVMNIMNHQHTGQRMDKEWTKNGQNGQRMDKYWTKYRTLLSQNFCAAIVAMLWSEGLGHKTPVVHSADPLHLHPMELRQLGRALKSTINIIGKNSRNSGLIYVLSQVLSNIVQTRHPQLGVM